MLGHVVKGLLRQQLMKNTLVGDKIDIPVGETGSRVRIPRVRFPLRAKITVPFLILAVGLAIGSAYVITQIVFDTVDERFTNQLIESGKLSSESMVRQQENLLSTLRLFSHAEGIPKAIEEDNLDQLRDLSYGIAANQKVDVVEFLDTEGQLVMSLRHSIGGDVTDYDIITSSEFLYRDVPFIRNVLEQKVDDQGDKFSGLVHYGWDDLFYVAGPVFNNQGNLAGVVIVGKTLEMLLLQIHEETLSHVTVYDESGFPIASTFFEPPELGEEHVATILEDRDSISLKRNLNNQRGLNVSNIDYEEILGPWEVRGDEILGLIGVSLPQTFLVHSSNATRMQITGLVSLTLLLVLVLGVNIANIITRPLRSLLEASAQVAEGDLTVQIEPKGNDEVAALTSSFNNMVFSLNQSKVDLLKAYDSTLEGWSLALEMRDRETEGHTRRVTSMTLRLARIMGVDREELTNIRRGALLHDIGKMGIPDSILLKPGKLSAEEWDIMRQHPKFAFDLLWPIEYLRPAVPIPYSHHEWWNGNGYPKGLTGENIPLAARIFAVVDVWDAMRSDRPYRKALPEAEVCNYIRTAKGEHFDPQVVEAFFDMISEWRREGTFEEV
jgi:HD-GYP domain-containing protein (c-di-GMP phosphodiesterase class II)